MKFKPGDVITPIIGYSGFENATVMNTFTEKKGKNKGKQYYTLKILCGTATIPISAEVNYKKVE